MALAIVGEVLQELEPDVCREACVLPAIILVFRGLPAVQAHRIGIGRHRLQIALIDAGETARLNVPSIVGIPAQPTGVHPRFETLVLVALSHEASILAMIEVSNTVSRVVDPRREETERDDFKNGLRHSLDRRPRERVPTIGQSEELPVFFRCGFLFGRAWVLARAANKDRSLCLDLDCE